MKKKICITRRLIHALILTAGFTATAFAQTDFWEPVHGTLAGQVFALAVDRNGVIFAGTNIGVARSVDDGDSWQADLPGRAVLAFAINNAGHIFAGTIGRGVYRSTDQGKTWSEVNNGLTLPLVLALVINSDQHLFVGTYLGGVFRSTDNGDTWAPVNDGLTETFVPELAVNSAGHLFAGTDAGVFRSTDNGDSWSLNNNGLPAGRVFALAVNAADHIFAGTDSGVFRSTNNGNSWEELNIGLNAPSVPALGINAAGHVFAAVAEMDGGGVYRSLNIGANWEPVNAGLPQATVFSFGFDRQGRILAGTDSSGVFRSIGTTTSVDEDGGDIPLSFALAQNYPNPFNPSTTIAFDLTKPAPVKLKVFDVTGREVAVLANQVFQAGTHKIVFTPNGLADGVYFYRIEAGEFAQTKKLTLLK
jgi:ligand-binding sensor domain-containing protein